MRSRFFIKINVLFVCISICAGAVYANNSDVMDSSAALKRGARTVLTTCMACHSLKYIKYRDLLQINFTREELNAYLNGKELDSNLQSLMPEESSKASFGKVPVDLSLIAKARKNGPEYVVALLTGFQKNAEGLVSNTVFPGIRMPDIFNFAFLSDNKEKLAATIKIKEAAAFLTWAADPREKERKRLGYYVMVYLFILTVLLYVLKRRSWAKLD